MKEPSPSRTADQFQLRFAGDLRDVLSQIASEKGISLTAEINNRLLASVDPARSISKEPMAALARFAADRHMSLDAAVEALLAANRMPTAPQVIHIEVHPDMRMADIKSAMEVVAKAADPDARVLVDRAKRPV